MNDARYRVQSLGRALDLLDVIAQHAKDGARLSDLARAISVSKAAAYALLQTLLARGFIADVGQGAARRYRLGMTLVHLGDKAIGNISLADIALPALRELTEEVDRTSRVAVLDDGYAVVVGRVDAPGPIRFDSALGRRELPHCSAVGKALLAALRAEEARAIVRRFGLAPRTPRTITSIGRLMVDLERIARRGYAIDDEEDTEGVVCVGTCVFDRTGAAAGAISVTFLKRGGPDGCHEGLATTVIRFADRISRELGGPSGAEAWRLRRPATSPG